MRVSHLRLFLFQECDSMVPSFSFRAWRKENEAKERAAAPSLRPENFAGHYPPESLLALLAQTGRPLTPPAKFSPSGVGLQRNGRGCCTSVYPLSCIGCGLHFRCERFSHTDAEPHREGFLSPHARGKFVSPRCGSLVPTCRPKQKRATKKTRRAASFIFTLFMRRGPTGRS